MRLVQSSLKEYTTVSVKIQCVPNSVGQSTSSTHRLEWKHCGITKQCTSASTSSLLTLMSDVQRTYDCNTEHVRQEQSVTVRYHGHARRSAIRVHPHSIAHAQPSSLLGTRIRFTPTHEHTSYQQMTIFRSFMLHRMSIAHWPITG